MLPLSSAGRPLLALLALILLPSLAQATMLRPGDLIVTDTTNGAVVRVDPLTGETHVVSQGGLLSPGAGGIRGVAVDRDRNIYAMSQGIIKIDGVTGEQSLFANIPPQLLWSGPLALGRNGDLFVAGDVEDEFDPGAVGGTGIVRYDLSTGAVLEQLSVLGYSIQVHDLAIQPNGLPVFTDTNFGEMRVGLEDGSFLTVTNPSAHSCCEPVTVASESSGDLLFGAANYFPPGELSFLPTFFRVDPETGDYSILSQGEEQGAGLLGVFVDAALSPDESTLFALLGYESTPGGIVSIDTTSGEQAFVVDFDFAVNSIAVVPTPEPSTLVLFLSGLLALSIVRSGSRGWRTSPT
jgi:hypothetical protein